VDDEAFSLLSLFVDVAVAAPRPHLVYCLAFLDDIFLQSAVFEPSGPADVDSTGVSSVFLKLPARTENIYLLQDRIQHTAIAGIVFAKTLVLVGQSVWQILQNLVHKPSSNQKTAVIRHKQSLSVVNRT